MARLSFTSAAPREKVKALDSAAVTSAAAHTRAPLSVTLGRHPAPPFIWSPVVVEVYEVEADSKRGQVTDVEAGPRERWRWLRRRQRRVTLVCSRRQVLGLPRGISKLLTKEDDANKATREGTGFDRADIDLCKECVRLEQSADRARFVGSVARNSVSAFLCRIPFGFGVGLRCSSSGNGVPEPLGSLLSSRSSFQSTRLNGIPEVSRK